MESFIDSYESALLQVISNARKRQTRGNNHMLHSSFLTFTDSFRVNHQSQCLISGFDFKWLKLFGLNIQNNTLSALWISSSVRNTTVWVVIIELICLFWFMFAVYFCAGCSATGNHSSKSSCINNVFIHTVAAA